jgi:acetyltransferase-like isoleucine patch superfamily enzyme
MKKNQIDHLYGRRLSTLMQDPRGSILFTLDNLLQGTQMIMDSTWCKILALMWGVQLGPSCEFYGRIHFRRYPGSIIMVGNNCRFRSTYRSNMIGINRPCGLSTHSKNAEIRMGNNCGLSGVIIGAAKSIVIGNHVLCGANVTITDFDWHNVNPLERDRGGFEQAEPVRIGDNVWLGLNTLVLKGVEIGSNTMVGANSLVQSSLPENVIAAGIPARVLRSLP